MDRISPLRSLRLRIFAAVLTAVVATIGAQTFLLWQQRVVTRSLTTITEGYLPLAKIVASLERDRQRVDNDVRRLLLAEPRPAGERPITVIYTEKLQENLAVGRIKARTVLRDARLAPEEQAVFHRVVTQLETLDVLFQDYQALSTQALEHVRRGENQEAQSLSEPLIRQGQQLSVEMESLARLLDDRIHAQTRATEATQIRATALSLGLTAVAALVAALLLTAVLYALRPVSRLTTEVQRLAAGERGRRVEVRGGDEIAALASEFNAMAEAIEARDHTLTERAGELNRLSRYLASVLDSLDEGLIVVEAEQVTLTNPASEQTWGVRAGEPLGPPLAPRALEPGPFQVESSRGRLHEVRSTRFGAEGRVVVSVDVTEQTLAKEQLARHERLALVGRMLAQITHEVRNPLNAMSLNAELLQEELEALDPHRNTEAWDILGTLAGEIDRLTRVTAHYLELTRRPRAQLEPTDPSLLARDLHRLLSAELSQHQAELTVEAEPLPTLLLDGNQLRQAVLNIVRNALEAGARALTLSLRREGAHVVFALEDDGPGMSPEELERATDPFFSTKDTGTGLGLAITRQILEDHGGHLIVASPPGGGAAITLQIPFRTPSPSTEQDLGAPDPRRG